MRIKICSICKKEFNPITNEYACKKCRFDKGKEYIKFLDHRSYEARLNKKICIYCNSKFYGKKQERLCLDCKGKHIVKKITIKPILCRHCGIQIGTIEKKTDYKNKKHYLKTCDKCRKETFKKYSERMKLNTNPAIQKFGRKKDCIIEERFDRILDHIIRDESKNIIGYITRNFHDKTLSYLSNEEYEKAKLERKLESYKTTSERMRKNNPMKNPEIRKKVTETIKLGYATGKIKKKFGKESPIWKGKRNRFQTIRTRLYIEWTRPIMERDNFACKLCGKTKCRLEVHHNEETFDNIMEKVLRNKNVNNLSDDEFEDLIIQTIAYHKNIDGITVCVPCHKKIDSKRR